MSILYGEQVIVLQFLPHVSNTVSACASRLSVRLESSLLAGIVLVRYFLAYLDIKLLMDELNVTFFNFQFKLFRLLIDPKNGHFLDYSKSNRVASHTTLFERESEIPERSHNEASASLQDSGHYFAGQLSHRSRTNSPRDGASDSSLFRRLQHGQIEHRQLKCHKQHSVAHDLYLIDSQRNDLIASIGFQGSYVHCFLRSDK